MYIKYGNNTYYIKPQPDLAFFLVTGHRSCLVWGIEGNRIREKMKDNTKCRFDNNNNNNNVERAGIEYMAINCPVVCLQYIILFDDRW